MRIETWVIGDTTFDFIETGTDLYNKRILGFLPSYDWVVLPAIKNAKSLSEDQIKQKEADLLLKKFDPSDFVLLLDEHGKTYTSLAFAERLEGLLQMPHKRIIFVVGGAYGFDERIYDRANGKISLSEMTFSHQIIRVIWAEQLYRAFSILHNQPYHHE
jgi:23S rRNA (pseudouridine1915-N3)-methyltransferase